jgi:hypothetical protein
MNCRNNNDKLQDYIIPFLTNGGKDGHIKTTAAAKRFFKADGW